MEAQAAAAGLEKEVGWLKGRLARVEEERTGAVAAAEAAAAAREKALRVRLWGVGRRGVVDGRPPFFVSSPPSARSIRASIPCTRQSINPSFFPLQRELSALRLEAEEQEAAAAQSLDVVEQELRLQERKAAQARERVETVMGELKAAIARLAEAEVCGWVGGWAPA